MITYSVLAIENITLMNALSLSLAPSLSLSLSLSLSSIGKYYIIIFYSD